MRNTLLQCSPKPSTILCAPQQSAVSGTSQLRGRFTPEVSVVLVFEMGQMRSSLSKSIGNLVISGHLVD